MIPGVNPRQMKQMMKRMGIQQQEIEATEVIIRMPEKEIIIRNPQVSKVNMMGQETFQIAGDAEERERSSEPDINDDDVQTVIAQTGASEEQAKAAIKVHKGDLAAAILSLPGNS
ncbi:TPA: nascent polypeptide-associated complex protein [Candidatus Woesearchaeota archaeon]|nr:nascent polypeptide-associated complex protein [Candidatus Woesearchaeota archaeon]